MKRYWIDIRWGSAATREENDAVCRYEFFTLAELEAFEHGVEEAEGWMDYQIVNRTKRIA